MADENDCCDLAVAYWYFLCNSESMNKRKRRKKQEWWFWIHDVISRRDDHRLVHAAASWSWTFSTVFSNVNVAVRYVAIAKPDTNWRRSIWPAVSVGYDTSKLYRDTDTDTWFRIVSWYWYLIHLPKCIMILIHFKSIMILDTLLIFLETSASPKVEAMDICCQKNTKIQVQ